MNPIELLFETPEPKVLHPSDKKKRTTSGFACMECGYKFKTVKAAEKASFGDDGCPKCGGSDIDLSP